MKFHAQRRMFYFQGTYLMLAKSGDLRSHKEWMTAEGVGHLFNKVIRGYADDTGIYLYKGEDFTLPGEDLEAARRGAMLVGLQLRLEPSIEVWAGVIPGPIGTRWRGRMKIGTLRTVSKVKQNAS